MTVPVRDLRYVYETCHEGSDWCVRRATAAEISHPDVETLPLDEVLAFAAEHGPFYDFSSDPAPDEEDPTAEGLPVAGGAPPASERVYEANVTVYDAAENVVGSEVGTGATRDECSRNAGELRDRMERAATSAGVDGANGFVEEPRKVAT